MNIYFFGVRLPADNIVGTPAGWSLYGSQWDNSSLSLGGGTDGFNNNWIADFFVTGIGFGITQSGFRVLVTTPDAPTSVDWFAYGFLDTYTGSFDDTVRDSAQNPGFEGTARVTQPVPEPGTLALLGLGLLGLGMTRRKSA